VPLTDIIVDKPRVLFVGINPGLRSEALGYHFAGKGNPFWRLLYAAKLIPEPLTFEQSARIAEHGLALTNIVPRATRQASELTRAELQAGRIRLSELIASIEPRIVAFVGVTIYTTFFDKPSVPGAGLKPERIGTSLVYVLPNPSGLNASYPGFAHKLVWFEGLARVLRDSEGT
jgi:double-stranded uracil-DNA glycosylase